jgi:hypothetical protein
MRLKTYGATRLGWRVGSGPAGGGTLNPKGVKLSSFEPEPTDHPYLNAQSPSQRSDGDCVLGLGTPVALRQ